MCLSSSIHSSDSYINLNISKSYFYIFPVQDPFSEIRSLTAFISQGKVYESVYSNLSCFVTFTFVFPIRSYQYILTCLVIMLLLCSVPHDLNV